MKINQIKSGVIISYITQIIHILTGIIYTPVMLRLLGQSEYGLYQLVYSVVAYLGLLSFGFNSGYMRFYARYKVEKDNSKIAKLNGMFMIIFIIISIVCLFCGFIMVYNAEKIFGSGLTTAELSKTRILLVVMVFNMAITFLNSVFTSNITAHEQFFFLRIIELFKALLNPFLTIPFLLVGFGSVAMVMVSTFLTVFIFLTNIFFCIKKIKIRFDFRGFDFALLKEMFVFTFFIFLNMIIDQINWSVDKFLLGRMMGTIAVAIYGVAASLNAMFSSLSTVISSVLIPKVNVLVAEKASNQQITQLFIKTGRIQFILLAWILMCYVLFGYEFICWWAGDEYYYAYYVGLILMVPYIVPLIQNLGIEIQRAKNLHKARSIVYLLVATSNIFISILLIEIYGVIGASIGTALTLLIGNGIFMNIYYYKKIKIDILLFWKEIFKFVPSVLISTILGIIIRICIPIGGFLSILIVVVIFTIGYAISMWFIGINKSEKELFTKTMKRLIRK